MQSFLTLQFVCLFHLVLGVLANSSNTRSKPSNMNGLAQNNLLAMSNFDQSHTSPTPSTTSDANNATRKSDINWSESRQRPRHYPPKPVQVRANGKRSKKMLPLFLKPQVHPVDSFYYNDLDHDDQYYRKRNKYDDEVFAHNIDSEHYPHQYSIQVRWGYPGEKKRRYDDYDHLSKDDENSRYRQYAHQEEEHWHDKKWIDIGTPPGADHPPPEQYSTAKKSFTTLPVYARPMKHGASVSRIRQHFGVPSKSFPVNRRFVQWANSPVGTRTTRKRNHRSARRLPSKRVSKIYRTRSKSQPYRRH